MSKDKKKEPEMIKDSSVTLRQLLERMEKMEKKLDDYEERLNKLEGKKA